MPGAAVVQQLRRRISCVAGLDDDPQVLAGDNFGSLQLSGDDGGGIASGVWMRSDQGAPLCFPGSGLVSVKDPKRSAFVFLLALGKVFLCSLMGFSFRVGVVMGAGSGSLAGLLLLPGNSSAGFVSGSPGMELLETSSSPPSVGLPVFVQRFTSTLAGASWWWVLRLNQGLGSADGGAEDLCFDLAFGARRTESELGKMMNRCSMDLVVILIFFGDIFVKGEMYCAPV